MVENIKRNPKYQIFISSTCPMCRKRLELGLTTEEYEKYNQFTLGKGHIQELLPKLNNMEREFLISDLCPDCQAKIFGTVHTSDRFTDL